MWLWLIKRCALCCLQRSPLYQQYKSNQPPPRLLGYSDDHSRTALSTGSRLGGPSSQVGGAWGLHRADVMDPASAARGASGADADAAPTPVHDGSPNHKHSVPRTPSMDWAHTSSHRRSHGRLPLPAQKRVSLASNSNIASPSGGVGTGVNRGEFDALDDEDDTFGEPPVQQTPDRARRQKEQLVLQQQPVSITSFVAPEHSQHAHQPSVALANNGNNAHRDSVASIESPRHRNSVQRINGYLQHSPQQQQQTPPIPMPQRQLSQRASRPAAQRAPSLHSLARESQQHSRSVRLNTRSSSSHVGPQLLTPTSAINTHANANANAGAGGSAVVVLPPAALTAVLLPGAMAPVDSAAIDINDLPNGAS